MANYLWSVSVDKGVNSQQQSTTNTIKPPKLVSAGAPTNTVLTTQSNNAQGSTIDIVNDFYWTYSKTGTGRQEVPKIILTEKRMKVNSLIAQLIYSYGIATEITTDVANKLGASFSETNLTDFISGLAKSASTSLGNATGTTSTINSITDSLQQKTTDSNSTIDSSPYLQPYKNLYITEDTGWVYYMPYFENNYNGTQNNYGETGNYGVVGVIGAIASGLGALADLATILSNPLGANFAFQEKAKYYNFPTDGEELTFNFPLINTGSATFDDVIRNWQMLFLLVYQNKPGRISKTLVEPPVLYQVDIPGVKFMPYAYISGIQIDFAGARREISFNLPTNIAVTNTVSNLIGNGASTQSIGSSNIPITTIIPDAYNVKITLKSLVTDSKNFMWHAIGEQSTVTTNTINSLITTNQVNSTNNNLNEISTSGSLEQNS